MSLNKMYLLKVFVSLLALVIIEDISVSCIRRLYCPCVETTTKHEVLGYYWRDYSGKTPSDAVIGGYDSFGRETYIGQVFKKDYDLLPATFTFDCTSGIATAHGRVLYVDKNMKILCSVEPELMKWVPIKVGELDKLSDCTLVVGGSEDERLLHIGRVKYHGETIIGKVVSGGRGTRGLWIPYSGSSIHFTSYEMLTYNCTKCH
ncbi:uncharacterized protein LOC116173158 isoform X2 [Photinus pyralis]|uniref:uncharacterized protein LOC116173158 isoform X2 n=1 Tax=Photinus pyralis TaxID=7054 RepID=UPI001267265F|nr:uncharacterized protein LOC116173158 isoform X2 [Photinus pyralis]